LLINKAVQEGEILKADEKLGIIIVLV